MKNFAEKLYNDEAERQKFIDFMHSREGVIKDSTASIAEKLNPFYVNLLRDFAKQEGYELEDSPELQEQCKQICSRVAENIQKNVIAHFHNALK